MINLKQLRIFFSNSKTMKNLILLLLLIVASCIARTLNNPTNKLSCVRTFSHLTICPHNVYGNITFMQPYINDCGDTMIIDLHMNITDITKTRYFHHYRGNITTSCQLNDLFNYFIIGHVYYGNGHFNGTASMCDDDCNDFNFEGQYELHGSNDTCHKILADTILC